ncbi:Hypothetical predicted protein [Paramuricea clavata]|uniref:Uncharacterized protein n=1 Tax=Paramuricea clavata TaxID=317549 RepID=A0A6S7JA01_PARCT|nr:Hypothetical predicted protein [Paramuricea clavata]CAB4020992.1 Hypothetical predicted protein [Paramuricea clavata]
MRSFQSRLDRIEQGQSKDYIEDNNEVVHDTELAPKHGGRKRKLSEDEDDESVLINKVLSNPADPAEKPAENIPGDTDNLLSNIAQDLSEQEPTYGSCSE